MRFVQNSILVCGVILIWLTNISPGKIYKGVQHAVGPDVAQVYEPAPKESEPVISIMPRDDATTNTGQRVVVYIRNDYRSDEIQAAPRSTRRLLGFLLATYSLASLVGMLLRRHSIQRQPPA